LGAFSIILEAHSPSEEACWVSPIGFKLEKGMKFKLIWKVLMLAAIAAVGSLRAESNEIKTESKPVKLFVREVPITVLGKTVKVTTIDQSDGVQGYSPEKSDGFHLEVVNQLPVPTSIHWHGLILPNLMDGVPYLTQEPIPPGGTYKYDFPLKQGGTYWMHSHYGQQEQQLTSAPMIIRTPAQSRLADAEFTVMLTDFSFTSPKDILKSLTANAGGMHGKSDLKTMNMSNPKDSLTVQQWDPASKRLVSHQIKGPAPDIDVKYDALLANRRTLDNPELFAVKPAQTVLLRLIAASAATNFFIDTGDLDATITATDGENVKPLKGNFFQLAVAQRLDLLVTIPATGGFFPILALGEGSTLQTGCLLATPGAEIPKPGLGIRGQRMMGGLNNTQEIRLEAEEPLRDRPVQRSLPSVLGGNMMSYAWTINGATYPNRESLNVKEGERVELVNTNETGMSHPMHLHGHVFEVTEIDGQKISGAKRDTILVPPKSTIKIIFDADDPGVWAYHCHILYHLAAGMFAVLKYEGADTEFWQPDKTKAELQNPLEPGSAGTIWKEMTDVFFASEAPAIFQ
jgi:FtsP/CotA-like multicopper oxidase with cupredoxin domain